MIRNALVVAGNKRDPALRPYIERFLNHEDAMLREAAEWAMGRFLNTEDAEGK